MNERAFTRKRQNGLNVCISVKLARSDLGSLGQFQGVFNINVKVAHGALDLRRVDQ
jgi:hypothetical protein